jgi:predicted TIM-barrel fold metal-dependent hydrolase
MPSMTSRAGIAVLALVAAATVAIAIAQGPQGQRGQGNPGARPGSGREPEFPVPNIREYKPESTLVVPQHPVPRAKFPAIDFHGHPPQLTTVEALASVVKALDDLNVRRMVVNNPQLRGDDLKQSIAVANASPYKDRFIYFTSIGFGRAISPGFGQAAAQQLEADVKAGAKGVQEIAKSLGLTVKKADGSRLAIDDPELDPIWDAAARLNIPVFIHTADPQKFWDPIDYSNERWLELALFKDRRYQDPGFPRFETLMAERDRLFKKHPKTTFVTAHLGWHANDLARLGRMFDEMPNVYSEIGAVLYDIGRQPRFAHDFFVKYQDRLLFGKDNYQPDEYPYYWRVLETSDEYFDYYRDYHAFWKLYGIALPDEVLKKLYFGNALKIIPGLSRAGFPQ